ncbi:hypothetical protein SAY86_014496 [Trapa natans]|uniref:Gibberellin-regulated protein 14 n=1 Tax=Trapa natans TaxID=22666 RepID=A0AAN7KTG3_TRANT|nr:hypothetical protein SAY86_014496 [Trapa natans]
MAWRSQFFPLTLLPLIFLTAQASPEGGLLHVDVVKPPAAAPAYVPPSSPPVVKPPVPVPPFFKPPAVPPVTVKPPLPPIKPPFPPVVKPPAPPVTVKPPSPPVTVKPPAPQLPPVKSKEDCTRLCGNRCSQHSRIKLCMRACTTCCSRCQCVPPGTYGNRELCGKCYTDMTTHGNRVKCP